MIKNTKTKQTNKTTTTNKNEPYNIKKEKTQN